VSKKTTSTPTSNCLPRLKRVLEKKKRGLGKGIGRKGKRIRKKRMPFSLFILQVYDEPKGKGEGKKLLYLFFSSIMCAADGGGKFQE